MTPDTAIGAILGVLIGIFLFMPDSKDLKPLLETQKEIRNELQTLNTTLSEGFRCVERVATGDSDFEVGKIKK